MVRPAGVDYEYDVWREQVGSLEQAATSWTGNDARVLEFAVDELVADEPVLDTAATEGIDLHGSLRRLLRKERRSA